MSRSYKTQLVGQIGEHLVVTELGRRNVIAAPFVGNVPDIDILAFMNGRSVPIQVKAQRKGDMGADGKKYRKIRRDGERQIIEGIATDIDRDLIFALVKVGETTGTDEFYLFTQGVVQDLIFRKYTDFLKKHNGVRPKTLIQRTALITSVTSPNTKTTGNSSSTV